jgi:uncharacterized membrane protein
MKPKHFIDQLDDARIVAAIAAAEQNTSGEIRVYVSHKQPHDTLAAARARFLALGMHRTRDRNAVLIYLVPRAQHFALWGDAALHEKCGESFWTDLTAAMTPLFKQGDLTQAVEHAVKEVGAALARHFPRRPDDTNELPDNVVRD